MLASPESRPRRMVSVGLAAVLVLGIVLVSRPARAAGGPTTAGMLGGFSKVTLAAGLTHPTAIAFAPNGDIYLGTQPGAILVYRNGGVSATAVVTLNTDGTSEKGLLGLALDPNFQTNGYLYVSYTTLDEHAQLSRLTVVNGSASLASEVVYAKGNQLQNVHHSANDVSIGPDGKLWWTVGDNDPSITNGETLTNIYGKIHRFNLDGTIPADNPFVNVPGAVPSIYAWGLRNPFRFTFLPSGKPMVADTGSSYWEEMDTIDPGSNYGWDFSEGWCGSCGYVNPVYAYGHLPGDSAVSAIAAYSGSSFPQAYQHVVFFGDYVRQDVEAVAFDPTYQTEISQTVIDSGAGSIADLKEGPDGNLYYVSIYGGTLTEILPSGPFPPTATATASPNAGTAPLTVQLSSAGSNDPNELPLTTAWDFGDGAPTSSDPSPTHVYAQNGTYSVALRVTNSNSQITTTITTVVVGHTPPTASIITPASGSTFNGGQTISFSGTATDPVDGTLPSTAYSWQVDSYKDGVKQSFYNAEVPLPFLGPLSDVTSATFTVPTDLSVGLSTFYRITLTVVDSLGLQTMVTRDVMPATRSRTVGTNVAGAAYIVDGAWHTTPNTVTDVPGVRHVLMGVPTQTIGGTRYRFKNFTDGGSLVDPIVTPATDATYTANYEPVQSALPGAWQSVDVGSPLMPGTTEYAPNSQTYYMDGSGSDVFDTKDQFRYLYQSVTGDTTIIARVRYQTNSSPWAKAGLMIKQSATAGSTFVDVLTTPTVSPNTPNINGIGCTLNGCNAPLPPVTPTVGNGVHMQWTGRYDKAVTAATSLGGFNWPNEWLKLQRQGNLFTSSYSSDGFNWSVVSTAIVTMTDPVTIGVFDTSHNIGQPSTIAVDHLILDTAAGGGPLPSPWTDADVGTPTLAGSAGYTTGVFTVKGSGADIYGTTDQFNYVNQPSSGNGTLIARVTSQSNTSLNAKAGIIVKQSTTSGSPYFLIAATPGSGIRIQWGGTGATGGGSFTLPNAWLKIVRAGTLFTAYVSNDGLTWTTVISKTLTLNASATVGLAVCSHNALAIGPVTFDNVSWVPGP